MVQNYGSPKRAPDHRLHRVVLAVDSSDSANRSQGMNMAGFRFANIQVVADAGQNPTTEAMFWCEEASKFINAHVALAKVGLGNGVAYEYTIEANGRVIWVKTTIGTGKIFICGWDEEHR